VEDAINQAKTNPARRRRSALNRLDLVLIVATTLAFVAVVAANHPHGRAHSQAGLTGVSRQIGQILPDAGLVRARLGAARMANG
jgi:hypothetical protein